jgi:ubiquinone/menaquinone biosynthesis C-methylase UbiE
MNTIPIDLIATLGIGIAGLASIAFFFLVVTRLSLIIQTNNTSADPKTAHIYWIYKNPILIRLADHMFVVSSILLLQYSKLVNCVVKHMNPELKDKRVLQISCAFGNVSEKIAKACAAQGAREFVLTDIMQSELDNAECKLKRYGDLCTYDKEDGTCLSYPDESFEEVVIFFLPHELPPHKKQLLIEEANRVVKPGGRVIFGEFHKPHLWILKYLGRLYFNIFEPYALAMWGDFDLSKAFTSRTDHKYKVSKETFLFGNYQVMTAEKIN